MSRKEQYYKKCSWQRLSQIAFMNQEDHDVQICVQESIIKWFGDWRYEQKPWGIIWRHGSNCCNHSTEHECDTMGDWFIIRACDFFFQCIRAWKLWFVWKSLLHVIAISSKRDESRLLQRWELTVLFVGGFTCVRQVSKLNILSVFSCPSLCSWTKWISILI